MLTAERARHAGTVAIQIGVAALGGLAFHLLGLPAAFLSGAVIAGAAWGALGFGTRTPRPLIDFAMLISGATLGGGITPEAIEAAGRYPLSLLVMAVAVVAITVASMASLVRFAGWRREDAFYACVPGAVSTVFAIALDRNAAVAKIMVVQSIRLLVLVTMLPSLIALVGGGGAVGQLIGAGRPVAAPAELALMLFGGLALGLLFLRLRLAAPLLFGAILVSGTLHATATVPGVVPPVVATAGLVVMGLFIGERFRDLPGRDLVRTLPAALVSLVVGGAVAAAFAALSAVIARVGYADAIVAFAPGGLEAMMMLALVLSLDPLFVGTHHLVRFLGIGLTLPLLVPWIFGPKREP
ncbi:MAG TPA: AbrB family transcriptional regulator [Beijerinckiaceae bacterium]|nr:AbrB family transcriptional regulator [Beijerinckiaceae bacterium]